MYRRDFLKVGGSAVAAGALAARTTMSTEAGEQAAAAGPLAVPMGLSVQSVSRTSAPVDFPDFTRGRWKTQAPWPIVHM